MSPITVNKTGLGFAIKSALIAVTMLAGASSATAQDTSIISTQAPEKSMIVRVNKDDKQAIRNIENVLNLYERMINKKDPVGATAKYLNPGYVQHNPLLPDGPIALGQAFSKFTSEREHLRVVVHRIIAVDDYVWAHVNFINLLNDDPKDTGVAGVDIYRFDAEGLAIEHWDTLQLVGDPTNAVPWVAPGIPAAHSNGMF